MGNRPTTSGGNAPSKILISLTASGGSTAQYPAGSYDFTPALGIETLTLNPGTSVILMQQSGNTLPYQNTGPAPATHVLGGFLASKILIRDISGETSGGTVTEGFSTCSSGWMWVAIILAIVLIAFIIYFYKKGQLPMINTKKSSVPAGTAAAMGLNSAAF
jgi:hypothetical protein